MPSFQKWISGASPEDRTVDVATLTLTDRLETVPHYLSLAADRSHEDTEYVHQLRVWSRRAAAAVRMYQELLPEAEAKWLLKQLKEIRNSANDARDLDVFVMRLAADEDPRAAALLQVVRAQRETAQHPIVDIAERLRCEGNFDQRVGTMLWGVKHRKAIARRKPRRFGTWAENSLRPIVKRFFKASRTDLADVASLHRFRIRGKDLRYAVELLAGAYPKKLRKRLYPQLVKLQECLGSMNDHAAAETRIRRWMKHTSDADSVEYLRSLLAGERRELEERQAEFDNWWTRKRRKKLQAGLQELKVRRPKQKDDVETKA